MVVAEVQVLELRHVNEGGADLHDGVVGHVQRAQVPQGVEGIARQGGLEKIKGWLGTISKILSGNLGYC